MDNLYEIEAFKSSPKLVQQLLEYCIEKEYKTEEIILSEDAYIRSIPIVTKGVLKVTRTEENGKEILLYYLQEGESCMMSILGGIHQGTSKVKVQVEEDATILFLPVDKIASLIKEYPNWLDYIFQSYHKRFEELLEIINEISFKKVDERLLNLLHKKQVLLNVNVLNITHEQLANELGTARVVISRLLKQLEEKGIVQLGRNKITLL